MTSRDNRPTSAQSRTAWGTDMDSGYGRPDNQFEFGPRDDPDLPVAMENDIYMDRDKGKNEVAPTKPTENQGCFTKFRKGVRCKFDDSSYISNDQNNLTYYTGRLNNHSTKWDEGRKGERVLMCVRFVYWLLLYRNRYCNCSHWWIYTLLLLNCQLIHTIWFQNVIF